MVTLTENPVFSAVPSADVELSSEVKRALRAHDPVGFERVRVRADWGVVTLTGSVSSWYARSLAYQLAERQPEVLRVVDAIRVNPRVRPVTRPSGY